MPLTTSYQVFLPFLNQHVTSFRGPSWFLSENVQIRRMTNEEINFLSDLTPRQFLYLFDEDRKVAVLTGLQSGPYSRVRAGQEAEISKVALCIQTVFNLVGDEHALSIPYGFAIGEARVKRLIRIHEFDIWSDTLSISRKPYRFRVGVTALEIANLFSQLLLALSREPNIRFALTRFSSALLKINKNDKLIDLGISLESLVPGGGEFGFRFPFFLSLIADQAVDRRRQIREHFDLLYKARSAVVHGEDRRDIQSAVAQWDDLVSHAKQCLLYRIYFETLHLPVAWNDHLVDLAYGQAVNIWDMNRGE